MEKCPIHDEAMKGLREDIHEVRAVVNRIEKMLHGNGEGLTVQAAKNTDFRLKAEKKEADEARNWKRIMPSVIGGIITALIVGLLLVLFPLMAKGEDYQNIHQQLQQKQAQVDLLKDSLNEAISVINIDSIKNKLTFIIVKSKDEGLYFIEDSWTETHFFIRADGNIDITIYDCAVYMFADGFLLKYETVKEPSVVITITPEDFVKLYDWLKSMGVIQ